MRNAHTPSKTHPIPRHAANLLRGAGPGAPRTTLLLRHHDCGAAGHDGGHGSGGGGAILHLNLARLDAGDQVFDGGVGHLAILLLQLWLFGSNSSVLLNIVAACGTF